MRIGCEAKQPLMADRSGEVEVISMSSGVADGAHCLSLSAALMAKMTDGVVLLDSAASVRAHNQAAAPWLAHCQSRVAELRSGIRQIVAGTWVAPVDIGDLFKTVLPKADYYLCRDGAQGYAVVIVSQPSTSSDASWADRRPSECANCLFPQQAVMYAQDLVLLLPHRPAGSTISNEELDYLAQITSSGAISSDHHKQSQDEKNPHS